MRRLLAAILWLGLCVPAFAAYQPAAVIQIPNAAALTGKQWTETQVQLSGYLNQSDGGEGTLVYMPGGCGTEDDGYCFHDASSPARAYARTNFNGDIRQYGVVTGAAYDCSPTTGAGVSTCTSVAARFAAMQTAAEALNFKGCLSTGGVQVKFSSSPTIDSFQCLTANKPWTEHGGNQFIDTPGTIWVDHGFTINMSQSSVIQNAIIIASYLGTMWSGLGPQTLADNYVAIHTMTSNGDTGVTCAAQSCTVQNSTIAGFDNAYNGQQADNVLDHVLADANVCYYFHHSGADTHWGPTSCQTFITKNTTQRQDFSVLTVTESPDTPGICRITINTATDGPPNTDLATGDNAWVAGADNTTGGAGANGRWVVTLIGPNTIDLQGSVCHGGTLDGPTTTITYTAGNPLATVSSAAGLQPYMKIKSPPAGISGTSYINNNGVWLLQNKIVLSENPTASGSSSVTFTGGAYTQPGAGYPTDNLCSRTGANETMSVCIAFSSQERVNAGGSAAGLAAGGTGCATAYLIGAFLSNLGDGDCYTGDTNVPPAPGQISSGFDSYSAICFAHALCFHLSGAYNARFVNSATDAARNLHDDLTSWLLLDGNFKGVTFSGGKAGKAGFGMTIMPTTVGGGDKGCLDISFMNIDFFDVEPGGCFINTGNVGAGGRTFVASGAQNVSFDGDIAGMDIYYEDNSASFVTSTIGTQITSGSSWWGGQFTPGGAVPAVDSSTLGVVAATCGGGSVPCVSGNDTAGSFIVATWLTNVEFNFANTWINQPSCTMEDRTDPLILLAPISVTTLHMQFGASGGGPSTNDKITWFCHATSN